MTEHTLYESEAKNSNPGVNAAVAYKPLVTVITPILNSTKYLDTCVQSVLNQSYANIEHIFVDGGSTDGTLKALDSYQKQYPGRIRFITGKDKGVGDAIRKGYEISKGEIISWLDSDDTYEPDAFETAVDFFRDNPDASFLYGDCNMIDEKGEAIWCWMVKDFNLKEALDDWHYLLIPAVFYKRKVIERVGYLNDLGNDLDFYIRVHKHFKMHRIRKLLGNWRQHNENISSRNNARNHRIVKDRTREDFFLILRYGGSLSSIKAQWYYNTALLHPIREGLRPYLGFTYPLITKFYYLMIWMFKFKSLFFKHRGNIFAPSMQAHLLVLLSPLAKKMRSIITLPYSAVKKALFAAKKFL